VEWPEAKPDDSGKSAGEKAKLRLGRIKLKEASCQRAARVARKKVKAEELEELIETFRSEPSPAKQQRIDEDNRESEEFWQNLGLEDSSRRANIFKHVSSIPTTKVAVTRAKARGLTVTSMVPRVRCLKIACTVFGCEGKHVEDNTDDMVMDTTCRGNKNSREITLQNELECKVRRIN